MAVPTRSWAANLLHLWFHELKPQDWWGGSDKVDALMRDRFEQWLLALHTRPAQEFLSDPRTALAAVLLFDQAPRNLYSGTPQAFAFDGMAQALTRGAIQRGFDQRLPKAERQFLYMPLMHSEDMADQTLSLRLFTRLGRRYGLQFSRDHARMIARFGRYPHRNKVLGRASTAAEKRAVEAGFAW